jgi:DNA ligase 1
MRWSVGSVVRVAQGTPDGTRQPNPAHKARQTGRAPRAPQGAREYPAAPRVPGVDYARLCEYYERLEATTKRLEMTDILVELAREADGDLRAVVYLTRGQLAADFVGLELGVAEKLVMRALHDSTGVPEEDLTKAYHRAGDLGDAAFELLSTSKARRRQVTLFAEENAALALPVAEVFERLHEIARASGSGSQGSKMSLLQKLLARASPREARYLVRTVTGKLRLGIADMTILDALAAAFATKEYRPNLERAYNVCSDLGLVAETLLRKGLAGVEELHAQVGVPMRAMLAERLPTPEEILAKLGGEALVELKYDGLRLQAHIPASGPVRFYSRRLEDMTRQFPDVAGHLRDAFQGREAIVEGEVVAVDPQTGDMRPFQEVAKRRGRKDVQGVIAEVPVTLFLFDCLLLDGQDLTPRPLPERRDALTRAFDPARTRDEEAGVERIQLSRAKRVSTVEELLAFFEQSVAEGAEGIMVKSVAADSVYRAGSRGYQWIKYKREYSSELQDTLDLVAIGAIAGRGRRAGWYGALIMASYNPEEDVFESICKLGTGFDDETLKAFTEELKGYAHEGGPHPRVRAKIAADAWFAPVKVLEVVGAELTLSPLHTAGWGVLKEGAGLSVRFPRFTGKVRDDKKPEEATTLDELVSMFKQQGHKRIEEAEEG